MQRPTKHPAHPLASLSAASHPLPPLLIGNNTAPSQSHAAPSRSSMHTHSGSDSPPVLPQSGKDGRVSKKRKVEGEGNGEGAAQHESPGGTVTGVKKRATLSCTECKRRKIKCDRKIPCLACVKRGAPETCRWTDEAVVKDAEVQPFALTSDILKLAARLQSMEEWANRLPPELLANAPPPQPQEFVPGTYASKVKRIKDKGKERERDGGKKVARSKREDSEHYDEMDEEPSEAPSRAMSLSDAEDAAQRLESIAFSARAPNSAYMPRDSLPFLDAAYTSSTSTTQHPCRNSGVDLTSMRTSIVAAPIVFDGPWSASALGFDLCFTLEELKSARTKALDSLWRFMPDRNLSYKLLEKYVVEVSFLHSVLHLPSFQAEHDRAWEMVDQGRRDEIDPLWLAVWCMVNALAIDGLRCQEANIELSPEERERCRTLNWYSCAQRFLQIGDGLGRPQVRYIQAVILIGQWLQTSSCSGQAVRFLTLLASAIRTAQILGLHQLSDDASHMPPPDPAWPPNACSVRRETALRLFSLLSFLDYISATTRFRGYILDPTQCSTPPVSNLDLCQLSIQDWKIEPHPLSIRTDSSFERAKLAVCKAAREVFSEIVVSAEDFSYENVRALDKRYRKVLQEFEDAVPSPTSTIHAAASAWQQLVCVESAHFRILRLHRPFMLKHEYSKQCCLDSAEKVIRLDLEVLGSESNAWFAYSHALGAAICLFSDLFSSIDEHLEEFEIDRKMAILHLAAQMFDKYERITLPLLRQVVQTGSRILHGLFDAEGLRRMARAASALVPGSRSSEPAPESFTAVLQRLTREVAVQAPPTQATPATATAPLPSTLYSAVSSYPSATTGDQPFPSAQAAPSASSLFSLNGATPGLDQSAFTLPFEIDDSYMPSAFLRDVGLTGASGGFGTSFDVFEPGNALGAAGGQFAVGVGQPYAAGGMGGGYYAPQQQQGGEWAFGGGGEGANGNGNGTGKMAASALLDELAGGVW